MQNEIEQAMWCCADGRGPTYAFVYPNIMINRYSMWTGTILVNPTGPSTCDVYMDYWVDKSKVRFHRTLTFLLGHGKQSQRDCGHMT